jgi:hypothetical protein
VPSVSSRRPPSTFPIPSAPPAVFCPHPGAF